MNRSQMSSFSFTVEDDLVSLSSAASMANPGLFKVRPFTKDYGEKGAEGMAFQNRIIPTVQRRIRQKAQMDAYRQLNDELFNPFEHKLHGGYINQADLYQREKKKRIQMIRKKQEEAIGSNNNYTIVFHSNKSSNPLQMAANNVLNEDTKISDYYNKKFGKKKMQNIQEEEDDDQHVQKDNFIITKPKKQKKTNIPQDAGHRLVKNQQGWVNVSPDQLDKEQQNINQRKPLPPQRPRRTQTNPTARTVQPPPTQTKRISQNNYVKRNSETPCIQPKQTIQSSKNIKKPQVKTLQNQSRQKTSVREPQKTQKQKPELGKQKNGNQQKKKKSYSEVYDGPDRSLVQQLEREITSSPNITFDDIAELQTAKNLLEEAVLLPRIMPEFFKGIRKAMKGILLFGPPGTGKTLLAKAVAHNNMFFNVSASSLASKWKGQSQKMIRLLFQMARYHSPSVIFFDEIDAVASRRSENEHESSRKVKTQLLVQMDGVVSSQKQVFVLAATNRPWDLDQALRRRLEKRIYIPLPGKKGRLEMFKINLKELKVSGNINWDKVVERTKGCSGADICNICRDAAYMPMRRKLSEVGGIKKLGQINQSDLLLEEISEQDLLEASKNIRPSVNEGDLKKYELWMQEFGST